MLCVGILLCFQVLMIILAKTMLDAEMKRKEAKITHFCCLAEVSTKNHIAEGCADRHKEPSRPAHPLIRATGHRYPSRTA